MQKQLKVPIDKVTGKKQAAYRKMQNGTEQKLGGRLAKKPKGVINFAKDELNKAIDRQICKKSI